VQPFVNEFAPHDGCGELTCEAVVERPQLTYGHALKPLKLHWALLYGFLKPANRHLVQPTSNLAEAGCAVIFEIGAPASERVFRKDEMSPGEHGKKMTPNG